MITAGKLTSTLSEDALGRFHRVPTRMGKTGRKMTPSARAIAGEIATYSAIDNPNASCKMSYTHAVETFGVTRATVSSSLSDLIDNGVIELSNRDSKGASYRFIATRSGDFIVVPEYLYTAKLANGKTLTKAQVLILAYIMTESRKKKNKGVYTGSPARIGWELHYSRYTVSKTVSLLLKNGLIYRAEHEKGVNKHELSVYHVNRDLFSYEKYAKKKAKKENVQPTFIPKSVADADARYERGHYYGELRTYAFNAAAKYKEEKYKASPRLYMVDKDIGRVEVDLVKTELFEPERLPLVRKKLDDLQKEREALYRRFGIDARKLNEDYYRKCRACSDTGYLVDGKACDCYLRRRQE